MTGFLGIDCVKVPRIAIERVNSFLRDVGRQNYEGLGLWVGERDGATFTVKEAVIPAQRLLQSSDGVGLLIEPDALHRLNVWLYQMRWTLIAQIHSHPSEAFHSRTDDEFAIATVAGSFSIVVPNFAAQPFSLAQCAVYRISSNGAWLQVPPEKVDQIFVQID